MHCCLRTRLVLRQNIKRPTTRSTAFRCVTQNMINVGFDHKNPDSHLHIAAFTSSERTWNTMRLPCCMWIVLVFYFCSTWAIRLGIYSKQCLQIQLQKFNWDNHTTKLSIMQFNTIARAVTITSQSPQPVRLNIECTKGQFGTWKGHPQETLFPCSEIFRVNPGW